MYNNDAALWKREELAGLDQKKTYQYDITNLERKILVLQVNYDLNGNNSDCSVSKLCKKD